MDWIHDFIILILVLIYLIFIIIIPKLLKEKEIIGKITARKIIHSFSGLAVLSTPFFDHKFLALLIALTMTLLVKFSGRKSKIKALKELYHAIGEEEEIESGYLQGPFAYCLAISILVAIFLFFPEKFYFAYSSIFIMMYADSAASIFGRKYGKHHINIPWVGSKRTLEGSFIFLIFAYICSLLTYYTLNWIGDSETVVYISGTYNLFILSFIMAVLSTILELLSPSKYDDLIVPLGTAVILLLIDSFFF